MNPKLLKVILRMPKTDPFGCGFLGRTNSTVCPVAAILDNLAIRHEGDCPLLVHADVSPLTGVQFVRAVKRAPRAVNIDSSSYYECNFRIGVATAAAAAASVSAYVNKMWESEVNAINSK